MLLLYFFYGRPSRNPEDNAKTLSADLIVGCDGAFSCVRQQMIKSYGFCYSQEYIEHGYLELCIPAKDNQFQMPANYLHIWPRDSFMMIALPNQDKSFTVTLSMPFQLFATLQSADQLMEFFRIHFKDAIPLIGEERLVKDFFNAEPQFLVSIKVGVPTTFVGRTLLHILSMNCLVSSFPPSPLLKQFTIQLSGLKV